MIWQRSDIDDGKRYRLHLCASDSGFRFFRLIELGSAADHAPSGDSYLATNEVPHDLLRRRYYRGISECVGLTSGGRFYVDSHGVWLTESEIAAMEDNAPFDTIEWITGTMPLFAPK